MSRIVAFGCSHTYGYGLPDCQSQDSPPSKYAFPKLVARSLNFSVLNKADGGASQKQIAATILQTDFNIDDIVIINWTESSRRGIWDGNLWRQLGSWNTDNIWKRFYNKYHCETDDTLDTLMNINLANLYLKGKCKKIINCLHNPDKKILKANEKWNNVQIDLIFRDKNFYYQPLVNNGHPDEKSHRVFAERILKLLQEDF